MKREMKTFCTVKRVNQRKRMYNTSTCSRKVSQNCTYTVFFAYQGERRLYLISQNLFKNSVVQDYDLVSFNGKMERLIIS